MLDIVNKKSSLITKTELLEQPKPQPPQGAKTVGNYMLGIIL